MLEQSGVDDKHYEISMIAEWAKNQIRFRGLILDRLPRSVFGRGEKVRNRSPGLPGRRSEYILKGLILAQNERWRRGLGMQVERIPSG